MTARRSVYIGRAQLRAAALELLRRQGFVPAEGEKGDVLRSQNLRAMRAVNDARAVLLAAARATGARARAWMKPPSLYAPD